MPEYLAPGVFIEEIERGPKPIEGVATSTAAFLGETERGPMTPRLVEGYREYLRLYGSVFTDGKYMPFGVRAFFDNGGRRCYIARIIGAGAAPSSLNTDGYKIEATGPGSWGDRVLVRITASTAEPRNAAGDGMDSIGFRLQGAYWTNDARGVPFDPFDEDSDDLLPRPD
jgi:phage tail sheath protein FI